MAIQFLHNLDLNYNELQNAKLQVVGTDPTINLVEGRIIYNSVEDAIKFYNGSAWVGLDGSGDISGVTVGDGMSGGGTSGNVTLTNIDKGSSQSIWKNIASDSGTTAANSNNDTITIAGGANVSTSILGDTVTINSTDTNTQLSQEAVEDMVGGMLDGAETFISVSYDDVNGNIDFVVPVLDQDNMFSNSAVHLATQQSIKAYVDTEINSVIDAAPGALDTLNELAAALGDDPNHTTTMTNLIAAKVAKTSRQALADAADALTISGHAITLTRGDGSTDVVNVPNPTSNTKVATITDTTTVTHSLGDDVIVQLYDTSTKETVFAEVDRVALGTTVTFASTPTNSVRVLIQKIG